MDQLIPRLMKTELFKDVSEDILGHVVAHASPFLLSSNQLLLSPGQDNHHIYLLLDGVLTVHFDAPDTPVVREIIPGYSVGEMSVIDGTRPSAYVKAKVDCNVFPLHRDFLMHLIQATNPIAFNLLRLMTEWMKSNTQQIIKDQFKISELHQQTNLDVLTGLYNRRWLDKALPELILRLGSEAKPLCILIIDIDHFKKYNDLHGHQGGDVALVATAEILKSNLRPSDFAARIGGEEFMVLLPNTLLEDGLKLAERLRLEVERQRVFQTDDTTTLPGVTVSVGLAVSDASTTAKLLFATADKQLYLAKQSGRNCVR